MRKISDSKEYERVSKITSFFVPGKEAIVACLEAAEKYPFHRDMLDEDRQFYPHPVAVLEDRTAYPLFKEGSNWLNRLAVMEGYKDFHDWKCEAQFNGGLNVPLARAIRSVLADLEFYKAILVSPWLKRNYR